MTAGELSRMVRTRPLSGETIVIEADEGERRALAHRFGLPSVEQIRAVVALEGQASAVFARGRLAARIVQHCAISGEAFITAIDEPLNLRFIEARPVAPGGGEDTIDIELAAHDCDEIEYSGEAFDLGEAIAQTLGLAIDPYAEGPDADAARKAAGITGDDMPSGPLAEALRGFKSRD